MGGINIVLRDQIRMLLFRPFVPRIREYGWIYLAWGLLCAWIAGVGRYWDHPYAPLIQKLGIVSVLYCFVLALLLWLAVWPLRPKNWSYFNVLVFVALTAPPALLYALPVEQAMSMPQAQKLNLAFLGIVSIWRVALLLRFLRTAAGLSIVSSIAGAFTPLVAIVTALVFFNVLPMVARGMAGLHQNVAHARDDSANEVVLGITAICWVAAPIMLGVYIWCVYRARFADRWKAPEGESE